MNDCLFCKIIKKELPSKTIYEDQLIQVIMNINPLTNGHLLVLPKKHFTNILDIDEELSELKLTLNDEQKQKVVTQINEKIEKIKEYKER